MLRCPCTGRGCASPNKSTGLRLVAPRRTAVHEASSASGARSWIPAQAEQYRSADVRLAPATAHPQLNPRAISGRRGTVLDAGCEVGHARDEEALRRGDEAPAERWRACDARSHPRAVAHAGVEHRDRLAGLRSTRRRYSRTRASVRTRLLATRARSSSLDTWACGSRVAARDMPSACVARQHGEVDPGCDGASATRRPRRRTLRGRASRRRSRRRGGRCRTWTRTHEALHGPFSDGRPLR